MARSTSPDPQLALWRQYVAGGRRDDALRNELALAELPRVRRLAARMHHELARRVDVDDLVQVGMIGVLQAAERYDPERGLRFSTLATLNAQGRMLDEARVVDPATRLQRELQKTCAQLAEQFAHAQGRPPTLDELAELTGRDVGEISRAHARTSSIDQVVAVGDRERPLRDYLAELQREVPHEIDRRDAVDELCRGLSRRERSLVGLYVVDELPMHEVAALHQMSESRVSQLLSQIRARIRAAATDA